MTTFVDHQHPRATDGRFTTKDHPEAELELTAPAITLAEATGEWGPLFHDMDARPAYDYTPTERAAAAFRTQFGAAPDAEVDGEYCFEGPNRQVLKIRATGRVAVNFHGPTRFAAEANMLSVMDPLPLGRLGSDPDGEIFRWLVGPDDFNAEDALKVLASSSRPKRFEDITRAILSSGSSSERGQTLTGSCRFCCRRWDDCYGATSRHRANTSPTASDSPRSTAR
jgi:hypothetical protein